MPASFAPRQAGRGVADEVVAGRLFGLLREHARRVPRPSTSPSGRAICRAGAKAASPLAQKHRRCGTAGARCVQRPCRRRVRRIVRCRQRWKRIRPERRQQDRRPRRHPVGTTRSATGTILAAQPDRSSARTTPRACTYYPNLTDPAPAPSEKKSVSLKRLLRVIQTSNIPADNGEAEAIREALRGSGHAGQHF